MNQPPERSMRERVALARADDRTLIRRHRRGDRRACELLVLRYLPLASSLALRYRYAREPLDDLVQAAAVGLLKAIDRWDPDRGTAFSSYAVPKILGEIRRHFRDTTWAVRPPRDLQELSLSVRDARKRLSTTLGREPTVADLADCVQRSPKRVVEALQASEARVAGWLDAPVQNLDDVTVGELIAFTEPGYARADARIAAERLMDLLDHRAHEIVRLRFKEDLTQAEIARRMGVSQMLVSRVLRAALAKLAAEGFEQQPRAA
jgi:RNA polymerase sigma-B factor